jgi:hypothetical protein
MDPPQSSRVRQNRMGKSNLSARGAETLTSTNASDKISDKVSITGSMKKKLNDPVYVFRPYSPDARIMDAHKVRPPILSKAGDSLFPPHSERHPERRSRKTCPDEWESKLQAPNFFETADFKTLLDDKVKEQFCRDFIERNKNRLWKFDLKYLSQTPRTVCTDIAENHEFIGVMRKYFLKEQTLNLAASENIKKCLKNDHFNSIGEIRSDDFLQSLSTSRQDRDARMRTMLTPSAHHQLDTNHKRGFNHTAEYGNFTKLSAILLANKGATLNR